MNPTFVSMVTVTTTYVCGCSQMVKKYNAYFYILIQLKLLMTKVINHFKLINSKSIAANLPFYKNQINIIWKETFLKKWNQIKYHRETSCFIKEIYLKLVAHGDQFGLP